MDNPKMPLEPWRSGEEITLDGIRFKFWEGQWFRIVTGIEGEDGPDLRPEWMCAYDPPPTPNVEPPRPARWAPYYFLREQGVDIRWEELPFSDIGPLTPLGPPSAISRQALAGLPMRGPGFVYNPKTEICSFDVPKPPPYVEAQAKSRNDSRAEKQWEVHRMMVEDVRKEREAWGYFEQQGQISAQHDVREIQETVREMRMGT